MNEQKILIVDDEESLRLVLSSVLSEEGYAVTEAASGEDALAAFEQDFHELVITDIRMGGMNGIELLQTIKTQSPVTEVIIMTSHACLDTAVTALRHGAYDYLVKPFEDLSLISAVTARAKEKLQLVAENRNLVEQLKQKNDELEFANRILQEMAVRDGLTGLHNHRHFQEALGAEVIRAARHNHPFAVLFLDVDYFKNYNDLNGHPRGDTVLRTLGRILIESLRQSDTVARYGGEEFTMILPETGGAEARQIAEKIRRRVAEFPFEGRERQPSGALTVSIGVAEFPACGKDAARLIEAADQALYRAKSAGRNVVA